MDETTAYFNPYKEVDQHGSRLPHWQQGDALQFVTFRLKDALPQSKLKEWRNEKALWLAKNPVPWTPQQAADYETTFTERIEEWLDAGMGSCLLRQPEKRKTIVTAIQQAEPANAELHAWVIMPNHAHVIFRPMRPLPELIKAWKRASAKHIGSGSIWQRNYRDTLIRNQTHYNRVVCYIRKNPIRLAQNDYSLWESETAKLVT